MATTTTLIPGLDDDAAYQCLLRASLPSHGPMRKVSRAWRDLVSSPKFYNDRADQGLDEEWLVATVMLRQDTLIMAFNPSSTKKAWIVLPPPPPNIHGTAGFCSKALGGKLYLLGGLRGRNSVTVFDPRTNRWSPAAPMLCRRANFACAAVEGRLYVVGGNLWQRMDAEVYDPVADRWDPLPQSPLLHAIVFLDALVVDGNKILVKSRSGAGKTLAFSAQDLSWEVVGIAGFSGRRCCVAHSNRIYEPDKSVLWRYETGRNSWAALQLTSASPSDDKKFFFRAVSCQKNIWAVSQDCKVVTVIQAPSDGGMEAKVVAVYKPDVPFSNDYLVLRSFDVEVLRA